MEKRKRILLALLIVIGAGVAYWFIFHHPGQEADVVYVSGNIEVTDAEVSFKIPGRVEERLVDEGQMVEKGACIALLESSELAAEFAMRQAELEGAQSQLAELEAGSRPEEIQAAKARFASAKADRDRLESDFRSAQQLLRTNVIAEEEFVHRKGLFDAAAARMEESGAQLKLIQEGPRQEQISQARARLAQVKAALQLAQTRLGYAKLVSPLSGVVLSKNAEPGEYVASGTPVVTVGELAKPWLRAYINETDLGRVKLGQSVIVRTDTYPGRRYTGHISFLAAQAEFTPKNVQTAKERVKLVYRIKVDLPNPNMELKPGMPADAEVQLGAVTTDHARH